MSNLIISGGVTLSGGFGAGFDAGGGGGGEPTLSVTSGLYAHFKADSLTLSDGASVTSWPDEQGGSGFTFVGNYLVNPPTYAASSINGNPAVRSAVPVNEMGYLSMARGLPDSDWTYFIVGKRSSDTSFPYQFPMSVVGASLYTVASEWVAGTSGEYRHISGQANSPTHSQILGTVSANDSFISAKRWVKSGNQTSGFLNGVEAYSGVASFTDSNGNMSPAVNSSVALFAARYLDGSAFEDNWNFQGDVAEFIVYDRALSPEEMSQVHAYLGTKYGINV